MLVNNKQIIIKNTLSMFLGQIISNLLAFILMVFIARYLGDVGVGQYSFIFAFGSFVCLLANPGLEYLIIKEVPGNSSILPLYGANILPVKVIIAGISTIVIFTISISLDKPPVVIHSLLIVCVIYGVNSLGFVFSSILQAKERMELISLAEIVERLTAFLLGFSVLYFMHSVLWLVLTILFSKMIRDILILYFSKRYFTPKLSINVSVWKALLLKSIPFSFSIVFLYIYYRIDTVMLSLMVNDQVTGWYNAAYRLIDVVNYIPLLIVTVIVPPMARSSKHDRDLLRDIFNRVQFFLSPVLAGNFIN